MNREEADVIDRAMAWTQAHPESQLLDPYLFNLRSATERLAKLHALDRARWERALVSPEEAEVADRKLMPQVEARMRALALEEIGQSYGVLRDQVKSIKADVLDKWNCHELQIWKAATPNQYDLERGIVARVGALESRLGVGEKDGSEPPQSPCDRAMSRLQCWLVDNHQARFDVSTADSVASGMIELAGVREKGGTECEHEFVDPTNSHVVADGYAVCVRCGLFKAPAPRAVAEEGVTAVSVEQRVRDILDRLGVEDAQSFTSGDLVELANAIRHEPAPRAVAQEVGPAEVERRYLCAMQWVSQADTRVAKDLAAGILRRESAAAERGREECFELVLKAVRDASPHMMGIPRTPIGMREEILKIICRCRALLAPNPAGVPEG